VTRIKYIYVAGPFSSDPEGNVNIAIETGEHLTRLGLYPFIPHLFYFWDKEYPHSYEFWIDQSRAWIRSCDAMYRIRGLSPGADREVEFARELKMLVFFHMNDLSEYISHQLNLELNESHSRS
jgi:hypothetical protein